MEYKPHNYQQYCIERIIRDPAIGLFLRPGLGKTSITLTAANYLKYYAWQVSRVLVVAPKKVAEGTWSKEAQKWDHLKHLRVVKIMGTAKKRIKAVHTPADIYVINRENIPWLVDYLKQDWCFDMVVLDESTSFKNGQSKRFKAIKLVRRFIKKMVLLTGTPTSKGLMDLWAQVYLLDEGLRLGTSITQYRTRYFDPDKRNRDTIWTWKAKDDAMHAVLEAISDICISMKSEDYLELPKLIDHEIPVVLDEKAKKAYDQFERDLLLTVDDKQITASSAAVLTNKLLQMCNGAVYQDNTAVEVFQKDPSYKGAGFRWINENAKSLIFTDNMVFCNGEQYPYETSEMGLTFQISKNTEVFCCAGEGDTMTVITTEKTHEYVTIHDCKLDAYMELLEELNGEHALTFYNFQHDKERILDRLSKIGLRVRVYETTEDEDAWNRGEVDILLAHPASCAYGLNLQEGGCHIIWYGLQWSFELNDQGVCRLLRQGSPYDKIYCHYLVVEGGADENVMSVVKERTETHETVMDVLKARIQKVREEMGNV